MTEIIDFRVRLPAELRPGNEPTPPPEYRVQYDAVLGLDAKRHRSFAALQSDMDDARVGHAVVHAEYEYGDPADALNDAVGKLIESYPDRFSGFGTVSMAPLHVMRALRQMQRVSDLGMVGISIQPSFFAMPMHDRQLYPIYAKAVELELMVAVHSGVNYSVRHPISNDHPLQIDQVACDFPELTIVACHAGWPWAAEMVAVARKHPNVVMEFGGLAPKYVSEQNTGWEVMFRFMNTLLSKQVLFGTDWPVFPTTRAVEEWQAAGLKPDVLTALLGGNARRLLGRSPTGEG